MRPMIKTSAGLALPFILLSTTAIADVSPAQVWGDWRTYMEGFGYSVAGTETVNGNALSISDVAFSVAMPEADGNFAMRMENITFTQNADGTVSIDMPAKMPIEMRFTGDAPNAEPVEMEFTYTQIAPVMTASGTAESLAYNYDAQSAAFALEGMKVGDAIFDDETAKMSLVMNGISTVSTTGTGNLRTYNQTGQIADVSYDVQINNPEDGAVFALKGARKNVSFDGQGALPFGGISSGDMVALIAAGFDVSGNFNFGDGFQDMQVQDPVNGNFSVQTTTAGGNFGMALSQAGLSYGGSQNDLAITANIAAMPFPITLDMAKAAFNLAMPISKSDNPQDFALGITMADFKMADMLWSIFDPQGKLPRDPATIDLDLTGKAKLLFDIMDPEASAQMTGQPGEFQALNVNRLRVTAAGAEVSGTGNFTFDNADMTTYPGMPKPIGAAELAFSGINGLIDNLIAMGFVSDQDAIGARMMMGLFTVAGSAPDTMTSRIEFNEEGQILANGQRIK